MATKPTIHLNGSSPERMVASYVRADEALHKAAEMLCDTAPNARDYYIQGDGAYEKARKEHEARLDAIAAIRKDMVMLYEHVQEQIDERDARRKR